MRRRAPREGKRVRSRSTTSDQSQGEHHEPELLEILRARAVRKSCEPETGKSRSKSCSKKLGLVGKNGYSSKVN